MDVALPTDTMSTPARNELGLRGEQEIQHFFQMHHFGVTRCESPDLGVDLRIEVKQVNPETHEIADLSYIVGCQVKTGDSYFSSESTCYYAGQERQGVWFRCDYKHRNYWTRSNTRVFLILQREGPNGEPSSSHRYWQWLDDGGLYDHVGKARDAGGSYKLFVPYDNKVDEHFCNHLIKTAQDHHRKQLLYTATMFTFDISQYKASQYARYALLLPDLVAPHPNRGFDHPLSWPEALALVAQRNPTRWTSTLDSFSTRYPDVPTLGEAIQSPDAGWRFAAAYYFALFENTTSMLESLQDIPPDLEAAKASLLASWAYGRQDYARTIRIVDNAIRRISCLSATDKAWLLIHKGNALCQSAQWDKAREAFKQSQSLMTNIDADLTAKRILNVASIALFDIEPITEKGLESLVAARDDDLSRFSLRRDANALNAAFKEVFTDWAEPNQQTIGASDTLVIQCQLARDTNLLAGDIPAYREVLSKLAIIPLALRKDSGAERIIDSLSLFLRAGDSENLTLALEKIRDIVNPTIVSSFMNNLDSRSMDPLTAFANLDAVSIAGDFLNEKQTDRWYETLLEVLNNPMQFATRYETPHGFHDWRAKALSCLATMRYQLSAQQLEKVTETIISNPNSLEMSRGPVLSLLRCAAKKVQPLSQMREFTRQEELPDWLRQVLNEVLSPVETSAARQVLHDEFLAGNAAHLHQIGQLDALPSDEKTALLSSALQELETIGKESDAGSYSRRAIDYGWLASNLLLHAGDQDAWTRFATFMTRPLIINREKLSAALVIVNGIAQVPEWAANLMLSHEKEIKSSLEKSQTVLSNPEFEEDVISAMLMALHGRRDGFDRMLATALSNGNHINRYNASLLRYVSNPDALLLEMFSSESFHLAIQAFKTFVSLCCTYGDHYNVYTELLQEWSLTHGSGFADALISAVSESKAPPAFVVTVLEHLAESHPSSGIRYRAGILL